MKQGGHVTDKFITLLQELCSYLFAAERQDKDGIIVFNKFFQACRLFGSGRGERQAHQRRIGEVDFAKPLLQRFVAEMPVKAEGEIAGFGFSRVAAGGSRFYPRQESTRCWRALSPRRGSRG